MKKLVRNVLRPIKKLVRNVGGAFGKVMNKLGPLGMLGMMFVMPYISNFWATMGNTIGGTGVGSTAAAEAGKVALQEATKKGLVEAGSKAAQNVVLEAGQEAVKQSLLQEGSGKIAAKIASKYASGTGQATGLFAGGTASKALGYTLKTLHNAASLSMNIFSTVTGMLSGAVDFVTGGSLTKLGNWVGDRFGDFQTRMGTATSEGYKKRLGTRLSNGDLTDSFLEIVKENQKGVFAQHSNLYPEGIYTPPAETLISKNLPSLTEMREQGTLTADARGTTVISDVDIPSEDTKKDISSLLEKQPTKEGAMAERDAYISMLEEEGSLKALKDADRLRQADFSKWGTEGFAESMQPPSLLEKLGDRMGTFFRGGEQTQFNPIYETDATGNLVVGPKGTAIETGKYQRRVIDVPSVLEKTSSAAGDAVANLPKKMVENYEQNWIDRKLGNVPNYINKYNTTPGIPGITYDSRNDYVLEVPRDDRLVATNNYNNNNNGVYSANPFATINFDRLNFDYGQGGIYGSG